MNLQPTTETSVPPTKRTREEALVWARGLVSQGIRVVRLRSGKTHRKDRLVGLPAPRPTQR